MTSPSSPKSKAQQPPQRTDTLGRPPRRMMGIWSVLCVVILVAVWLVPITYVGSFKKDARILPVWLRHQQRIACLFTHSVSSWKTFHVEVKREGATEFEEISEAGYFDMEVFGYRTRLHRILGASMRRAKGSERRRDIAAYFARRQTEIAPDEPRFTEIRFAQAWHPIAALAEGEGAFHKPWLHEIPHTRQRVVGHYLLSEDGRATEAPSSAKTQRRPRRRPR